jgi:crotonobetainyl-CoA:carnitine CoA-transferase CaiB-like acyl-CoA transferase
MAPKLLEGLRIADMSMMLFGPYCTQVLADLGADVIKLEPEGGDQARGVGKPAKTPGMGALHMNLNRGKRSVVWDTRSGDGRRALEALLKTSDVFIHNIRAKSAARLGLNYDAVRKIKPDIVYVHCVGFGSGGPYESLQAFDDVIQAGSGLASLATRVDGDPQPRYVPTAIADKVAGLHALYATLAGVIHKLRTGEGQHIEVPMLEALTSFTLLDHIVGHAFAPPTGPMGHAHQLDPSRRPVRTKDGYVSIAPYGTSRWIALFKAAGHPEVLEDLDLGRGGPPGVGSLLNARLAQVGPERTTEEWLALCQEHEVPAMRVNSLEDLFDDPHLKAVGFLRERRHPTEGGYIEVQPPIRFSARPAPEIGQAPAVGEHSEEVQRELGL